MEQKPKATQKGFCSTACRGTQWGEHLAMPRRQRKDRERNQDRGDTKLARAQNRGTQKTNPVKATQKGLCSTACRGTQWGEHLAMPRRQNKERERNQHRGDMKLARARNAEIQPRTAQAQK